VGNGPRAAESPATEDQVFAPVPQHCLGVVEVSDRIDVYGILRLLDYRLATLAEKRQMVVRIIRCAEQRVSSDGHNRSIMVVKRLKVLATINVVIAVLLKRGPLQPVHPIGMELADRGHGTDGVGLCLDQAGHRRIYDAVGSNRNVAIEQYYDVGVEGTPRFIGFHRVSHSRVHRGAVGSQLVGAVYDLYAPPTGQFLDLRRIGGDANGVQGGAGRSVVERIGDYRPPAERQNRLVPQSFTTGTRQDNSKNVHDLRFIGSSARLP
jgi:hypothetical protein